jgi:hypothetical protein
MMVKPLQVFAFKVLNFASGLVESDRRLVFRIRDYLDLLLAP